uniref:SJCHGC09706 protein n=1 Tax=Schistosoma japonicum TaxID=6182 RepID=Q5BR32_SCHJA|nr:SJCHGC09706 protein [Schistosoma japonicum]
MAITDKCRIDDMFLTYNKDRHGCINIENLKDMCKKIHIPPDDDILQALLDKYGTDGKMSWNNSESFLNYHNSYRIIK